MTATECTSRLGGNGPLVCTRRDPHVTGHVFVATWAPDGRHDDATEAA